MTAPVAHENKINARNNNNERLPPVVEEKHSIKGDA